jgi:hypothetical protein
VNAEPTITGWQKREKNERKSEKVAEKSNENGKFSFFIFSLCRIQQNKKFE